MGKSSLCLLTLLVVLAAAIAQEKYSDKFDAMIASDVDRVLGNDEERDKYYKCLMDTGPCDREEELFLKEHSVEAFVTRCRKCTDIQKEFAEKVTIWYTQNRPQEWSAMVEKFIADAKKMNITPDS
ncbi:ObirCsp1 [Ooceraea biroi]|uniref:ObirCsp1 n=1 Tax=Ooceraea biroi TaxID=2015173 RepID=A0A026WMR6_OOCBI|nr:ejaculatory bulb-specific protein 3 [Ooceraea biroi]EZA56404.1 hypothetical protein X777_03024 [Ooceraea biroi]RLU17414.1 ObirCsp1 [Ooceraea biroi]